MATFKIEVNVDWVKEDENLDEIIKEEIASSIIKTVSEKAIKDIETKVDSMVNSAVLEKINARLDEVLQDFMNRPRTITDKYGDTLKSGVSVMDLLKEQCDQFIDSYVDNNGNTIKTPRYGESKRRIDYIIEKNIDYEMKRSIERSVGQIKDALQKYINDTLKAQIGENIAKAIGLDKITAQIKE